MDSMPPKQATLNVPGGDTTIEDKVLETGASMLQVAPFPVPPQQPHTEPQLTSKAPQDFQPVKQLCAHLNAFHTYADEPGRHVEANHYCAHLTEGESACVLHKPVR